jgi:hypothetical protein
MRRRMGITVVLVALAVMILPVSCLAIRTMIQGQVVDADTGQPIENAAILIDWSRIPMIPGLVSSIDVEHAETVSDAKGYFTVPNHHGFIYEYYLTIYRKGYVCWSNRAIFPRGIRKGFKLKDGVIIRLEPFKSEYSRLDHAHFTLGNSVGSKYPGLFNEAVKEEEQIETEYDQQRAREDDERRGRK